MSIIADNINHIKKTLPANVKLIAVSKTKPNDLILEAYKSGQRIFGENKVQELEQKYNDLPKDIEWHMIGHLQTNKIKYIAPFVSLIHSVDSIKLLEAINKEAIKNNRIINCLLQVYIATEETKFGFDFEELTSFFNSGSLSTLSNISICGFMGMATFTSDENKVRLEFKSLASFFNQAQKKWFANQPSFKELSMGMSDDYLIAIGEGSTMIRVGSKLFGSRIY